MLADLWRWHHISLCLILIDAQNSESFVNSLNVYAGKSEGWNNDRYSYIKSFNPCDLKFFTAVKDESVAAE